MSFQTPVTLLLLRYFCLFVCLFGHTREVSGVQICFHPFNLLNYVLDACSELINICVNSQMLWQNASLLPLTYSSPSIYCCKSLEVVVSDGKLSLRHPSAWRVHVGSLTPCGVLGCGRRGELSGSIG